MGIQLTVALVQAENGELDLDQSMVAFKAAFLKEKARRETELGAIAGAVEALFDEYKGTRINMPAVQSMVAQKLNVQPENHKVITDRIAEYVRANSQGEKRADGSVERPDSLFVIGKGRGTGGCARRADLPAKDATAE